MAGMKRWGSWEELLLAGAVLRHGTTAWDVVTAELRARTPFPSLYTPQECEAKYEDLQPQYSSCNAWFEELRKRRVAELRRELEISEGSIGLLQSKLDSLNAERESDSSLECNTSCTKPPMATENVDGIDSSSKEAPQNGLPADCYSGDTGIDCLQECPVLASVSSQENDMNVDLPKNWGAETGWSRDFNGGQRILKKKRGHRMRRDCSVIKDESVGGSSSVYREELPRGCEQDLRVSHEDSRMQHEDPGGNLRCKSSDLDLARILDSITKHKDVSIFQHRLESQKGARYKKLVSRHVDLQNISSRIRDGSISSVKELFRDLCLLVKNALVFYPKDSSEEKSAIVLRELLLGAVREHSGGGGVKLQGLHSFSSSVPVCVTARARIAGASEVGNGERGGRDEAAAESRGRKRGTGRAVRGGRGRGRGRQGSPNEGRKRARIR